MLAIAGRPGREIDEALDDAALVRVRVRVRVRLRVRVTVTVTVTVRVRVRVGIRVRVTVALPYATVGEVASCALQSLPVLKTVRMPSALSAFAAATLASKSSSCVTVALGPLRWQTPPKAFSVSARLKPASA